MLTNATPIRRPLLAAALLIAALAAPARADLLDLKLNGAMPDVMARLKKKGYKNVGTLRFQVKRAGKPASYGLPLSGSLATRVENLLVIHGGPKEKDALGVIHDASRVARAKKVGAWPTDAAERRKLFTHDYPLAWGRGRVKPDAFLTGQVEVSKDMRTTTLRLQVFDRKADTPVTIKTLSVETDRQVVRDLGYSFALSSRARGILLAGRSRSREVDRLVLRQVVDLGEDGKEDAKEEKSEGPVAEPGDLGGVSVEMLADGAAAEITRRESPGDPVAWQVVSPEAGKKVTFRLKNNGAKQLAVVLRLNGVNAINEQRAEPESAGKVVLDPGESQVVEGFVLLDEVEAGGAKKKVRPFKVLTGEEAATAREELGDKAGLIEVDVFEKGRGDTPMKVTLRGLPAAKERALRKNYGTLRKALMSHGKLTARTVASREVIVPDRDAEPVPSPGGVKIVSFERPQVVARIAIKVSSR